jgi:hypothetical protein
MASQIIIFNNADFSGTALLVNDRIASLGRFDLNDRVSSFIILSGTWKFYAGPDFRDAIDLTFGPGQYNWVEDVGIPNDQVSSLRAVSP